MSPSATILGATKALSPALMWLGALIVVVMIAGLVILKIRESMLARESGRGNDEGLLSGLRRMRDLGEISPEQYDVARKSMAARAATGAGAALRPVQPRPAAGPGELRSPPGFDLTGAPLPDQPSQGGE